MPLPKRKNYTIETRLAKKRRRSESSLEGPPLAKRRKRDPVKRKPNPVRRSDPFSDRLELRGRGIHKKAAKKAPTKLTTAPLKKRLPSKRAGAPRCTKKEQSKSKQPSKQATTKTTNPSSKTRKPKANQSITKTITNKRMDKTGAQKEAKMEPEKPMQPGNPDRRYAFRQTRHDRIDPEMPKKAGRNKSRATRRDG